jgi:hypothetical protein
VEYRRLRALQKGTEESLEDRDGSKGNTSGEECYRRVLRSLERTKMAVRRMQVAKRATEEY